MKVAIFGLGYVGAVSAACLAKDGHTVIGVDANPHKVDLIKEAKPPVIEQDLEEMIADGLKKGTLSATTDPKEAIENAELAIICVGTPSKLNGDLDLSYVGRVCEEIGKILSTIDAFRAIVIRSTVLPGTIHDLVIPTLERHSGKTAGEDFGVGFFPEFLREGTAVWDFYNPPKIVFGTSDTRTADMLKELNKGLDAPVVDTHYRIAELVKYADNTWHAIKVAFGNEIGSIAKAVGVDGGAVMDIFCLDRKLNISEKYLRPGFAFGGSCLPKDVRALSYKARSLDLDLPLLNAVMPSNERHIDRAMRMILDQNEKQVGILGLSFKAGTDDLRESPVVELVERLLGKGHDIRIYDRNVNLSRLVGANKAYIFQQLPHIASLLADDVDDVINRGGTIVLGNNDASFNDVIGRLNDSSRVIDLVRLAADTQPGGTQYHGICW